MRSNSDKKLGLEAIVFITILKYGILRVLLKFEAISFDIQVLP